MLFKSFRLALQYSNNFWLLLMSWISHSRRFIFGYYVLLRFQMIRGLWYFGRLLVLWLTFIRELLAFIFGALIISWLIFNRLIRTRLPTDIPTFHTITSWGFVIYCSLFVITLIFLLFSTKHNNEDLAFFKQLGLDIQNIFIYSFRKVHLVITDRIPNYIRKILFLSTKFRKLQGYYSIIVILCVIIPPIVVSIVFLVDIIYFHKLDYFYKSLVLLLMPLLFKGILGIFRHIWLLLREDISMCLLILKLDEYQTARDQGFDTRILAYYVVTSVEEFTEIFFQPMTKISSEIFEPIDKLLTLYQKKSLGIYIFCYTLGFGYIAFHGFF
jgi:hypothetical protein